MSIIVAKLEGHKFIAAINFSERFSEVEDFYMLGPSFISTDGEYRDIIITRAFYDEVRLKYLACIEPFEVMIRSLIKAKSLSLSTKSSDAVILLACSWIYLCHREAIGIRETNRAEASLSMITGTCMNVYKECMVEHGDELGQFIADMTSVTYGVKMTPLKMGAADSMANEYARQKICYKQLTTAGVTDAFRDVRSIYTINLGKESETYYDSPQIRERYKDTKSVNTIITALLSLSESLAEHSFGMASEQIATIAQQSRTELLTATHLVAKLQKNGETFANRSDLYDKLDVAAMLFKYSWALVSMHTISKIVHRDLHMNNVTIRTNDTETGPEVYQIMSANNEPTYTFRLDSSLYHAGVIDFSRAIMYTDDWVHITAATAMSFINMACKKYLGKVLTNTKIIDDKNHKPIFWMLCVIDLLTITNNIILITNTKAEAASHAQSVVVAELGRLFAALETDITRDITFDERRLLTEMFPAYLRAGPDNGPATTYKMYFAPD